MRNRAKQKQRGAQNPLSIGLQANHKTKRKQETNSFYHLRDKMNWPKNTFFASKDNFKEKEVFTVSKTNF